MDSINAQFRKAELEAIINRISSKNVKITRHHDETVTLRGVNASGHEFCVRVSLTGLSWYLYEPHGTVACNEDMFTHQLRAYKGDVLAHTVTSLLAGYKGFCDNICEDAYPNMEGETF
tara:strand:- start:47 stop:400 length:354 start_codon:yes stop_codon:yes gene_type:complete